MTAADRIRAVLPPPLTDDPASVLGQLIGAFAQECDAAAEDLDRLRRTRWIGQVYRLQDIDRLGALLGIDRFVWEDLTLYRSRLLALVAARLRGAVGREELRLFVLDYLRGLEAGVSGLVLVPGLAHTRDADAFGPIADRPLWRPFVFDEWPQVTRRSGTLAARRGRAPYLHRWTESNGGLDESHPRFVLAGYPDGATVMPMLVNLTTREMIGFGGTVPFGSRLVIEGHGAPDADGRPAARASLDGDDATDRLISLAGFAPGTPFERDDLDPEPRMPRMVRGANRWVFLIVGRHGYPAHDRVFFALTDEALYEGVFDETRFDDSLFAGETRARIAMTWRERQPASFTIRVPQGYAAAPVGLEGPDSEAPHTLVARALRGMVGQLRAAGVRSRVETVPFRERQAIRVRFRSDFRRLPPDRGSPGQNTRIEQGARYGETGLGRSRFE